MGVDFSELEQAIENEDLYVDHPLFYAQSFTYVSHRRKRQIVRESDNLHRACFEEYDAISRRLDKTQFQEACSVRNVLRTRRIATLLIDDKGEINLRALPGLIESLEASICSLGPNRQYDTIRQQHILAVVKLIQENSEFVRLIKSIDKPISHKYADKIIRETLMLPSNTPLTDAHVRRAALAAWMCTLRQSVGSCFATAPAIIIHREQPHRFLTDIRDLLSTGRLKRTFGGVEYSVPLSTTWGAGDLKKPFVVPVGEEFEKSNLWLSPGLAAGFEGAGLFDSEDSAAGKIGKIKELLREIFGSQKNNEGPYVIVTAEAIFKAVLMKKLNITPKDLEEYENRSVGMIHGGIFFQPTGKGLSNMDGNNRNRSKRELCALYLDLLQAAGSGLKSLSDNALLKAWEFSLASFAETKAQFTRWNLYSCLGLGAQEKGGIGGVIYEHVKNKVEDANRRVEEFQREYEFAYAQIKTMESRVRSVESEREAKWLQAEYQIKRNEFYTLEEMRDKINRKAHRLSRLYEFLIHKYDELFPKYFQEVYDADMQDVQLDQYDDSPAGFRLLYKYGRVNTSQWTYIYTPAEFIESLVSFFTATEIELSSEEMMQGLQQELSDIVTQVVAHVRTKEFLESAFYRMAVVHKTAIIKDPLDHLDKIDKKPWAYTSGGTMENFVSCYYRLENKPAEVDRWVENPMELAIFLSDTMKQMPVKDRQAYLDDSEKSMLMYSPTHAFIFKPGRFPFCESWKTDELSYIWFRDNFLNDRVKFLEFLWMDRDQIQYLVDRIAEEIPNEYRYYFKRAFSSINKSMHPKEFRDYIIDEMEHEKGLRLLSKAVSPEKIDSLMYSLLPLFKRDQLRERVEAIFMGISVIDDARRRTLMEIFDRVAAAKDIQPIMDAEKLQGICKGILCLGLDATSSSIDFHKAVSSSAQQASLALPEPMLIADTNWVKYDFGFLVNPGTCQFEFWRTDRIGRNGSPMAVWAHWLDGSRKKPTWGVYTKPYEYGQS